jgi:hypothetical protein
MRTLKRSDTNSLHLPFTIYGKRQINGIRWMQTSLDAPESQ